MKRNLKKYSLIAGLFLCGYLGHQIYYKFFFRPYLTIVGSVCMADGLGRQSVELINTLHKQVSINFVPTTEMNFREVPKAVKKVMRKKHKKQGKVILFEDCVWVPNKEHYKILDPKLKESQVRIAYSMFESTKIPSEWVEIFNRHFDAVAVPDAFHLKIYRENGVTVPLFLLPLGLDLSKWLQSPCKNKANRPFLFATLGAGISRKNICKTIEAFAAAFGNNPDVHFLVHCRYALPEIEEEIQKIICEKKLSNVHYHHKRLSREKYLEIFQGIDCYVNLSKGEGFSIQPREAMALGIPVILSDNTAQSSICATELVRAVPSQIPCPAERRWGGMLKKPKIYGEEFDWEVKDASQAFLEVYQNYEKFLSLSQLARNWALDFDYSRLKKKYENLICPKKIILGDRNEITEEYLMTDSPKFYEKCKKLML